MMEGTEGSLISLRNDLLLILSMIQRVFVYNHVTDCCLVYSVQFYNFYHTRSSEYLIVMLFQCTTATLRKEQSIRLSWCVQNRFNHDDAFE